MFLKFTRYQVLWLKVNSRRSTSLTEKNSPSYSQFFIYSPHYLHYFRNFHAGQVCGLNLFYREASSFFYSKAFLCQKTKIIPIIILTRFVANCYTHVYNTRMDQVLSYLTSNNNYRITMNSTISIVIPFAHQIEDYLTNLWKNYFINKTS